MKRALLALSIGCGVAPSSPVVREPPNEPVLIRAGGLLVHAPARADGVLHVEAGPGVFVD